MQIVTDKLHNFIYKQKDDGKFVTKIHSLINELFLYIEKTNNIHITNNIVYKKLSQGYVVIDHNNREEIGQLHVASDIIRFLIISDFNELNNTNRKFKVTNKRNFISKFDIKFSLKHLIQNISTKQNKFLEKAVFVHKELLASVMNDEEITKILKHTLQNILGDHKSTYNHLITECVKQLLATGSIKKDMICNLRAIIIENFKKFFFEFEWFTEVSSYEGEYKFTSNIDGSNKGRIFIHCQRSTKVDYFIDYITINHDHDHPDFKIIKYIKRSENNRQSLANKGYCSKL